MWESTRQWWNGETPRQIERRKAALRHPVRGALLASLAFFLPMWALTAFNLEPVVLALWVVGSLGFGFGLVWLGKRKAARIGEQRA